MSKLINQLLTELKRDKKRAATLGMLAVVALILVGRLCIKQLSTPQETAAATPAAGAPAAASAGDAPSLASVSDEAPQEDYLRWIDTTITRDIFAPPERYFPPPTTEEKKSQPVLTGRRDAAREDAWRDAAGMELMSTILSATPKAIIDGQLVEIGDAIKGFRVTDIGSRSVTLERDGVSVTLEMSNEP